MDWNDKTNRALIGAFLALETADEAQRFLRDLLTENEIDEFAKRLRTAQLLADNVPYSAIEAETGLSSTTVARVAAWLRKGTGGYSLILKRLKK